MQISCSAACSSSSSSDLIWTLNSNLKFKCKWSRFPLSCSSVHPSAEKPRISHRFRYPGRLGFILPNRKSILTTPYRRSPFPKLVHMLTILAAVYLVSLPESIYGYGSYYPGYGSNGIVNYDAPTCSQSNCWRRDIIVTQDITYNFEFYNETLVESIILSGPTNSTFTPKLDPYIITNMTTIEYSVTDLYYYTWTPSAAAAAESCGCPECNLVLKNESDPSPYPLVGCSEYSVSKIPGRNSPASVKMEISYVFL